MTSGLVHDCPCGSGTAYRSCCGPLHDGTPAATAEALMRSRYSAYVVGHADHVFRTWHPRTRPDDVTLTPMRWVGLEILRVEGGTEEDSVGLVEFVAHHQEASGVASLREVSTFERRGGRWVYVDGDVV